MFGPIILETEMNIGGFGVPNAMYSSHICLDSSCEHSRCVKDMLGACSRHVHGVFTVCSRYVHGMSTVYINRF